MFVLLGILIFIYLLFSFFFKKKGFLKEVEYTIQNETVSFEVKEKITYHEKNEKDSYFFEISVNEKLFPFQMFTLTSYENYKIQKIDFYEDAEYTCIAPSFKEEDVKPILCKKENILYPYHTIKGENKQVDAFASSVNYDEASYIENTSNTLKKGTLTIYPEHLMANHYLALENYKGLTLINQKEPYKNIELFTSDKYTKNMALFTSDSYLTADYNAKYSFNEFYLVNIKTGKKETIISNNALNLEGYAMGVIDNKVYFYDKSDKEQYAVSLKNKKISKIGDKTKGVQIYQNQNWQTGSISILEQSKVSFYEEKVVDEENTEFERIDKLGGEKTGIYYFYKREGNIYHVYCAPTLDSTSYIYLFDTTNIENIVYQNQFIYYMNGNAIRYYSPETGSKTVLTNTELAYNKSLKFGLFIS